MSASEPASLTRFPSPSKIKAEHFIVLVDHTASRTPSGYGTDTEANDSDTPLTRAAAPPGFYQRLTNNSLRETVRSEYNKQKYARYGQDRYHVDGSPGGANQGSTIASPIGETATVAQKNYLERAQKRARALVNRKRALGKGDSEDVVVDVLYENQRGMFFFGVPKYSSASLLPSDPRPWQNGQFRTSAVDIRNAQVPDPSWEWAWKSWYVDMSRDVDEEGWEYSFAFVGKGATTFAWHGNHPWFHSFVRRRRWLRMRRRKSLLHHTKEKAHELTEDYFTIYPKTVRSASLNGSQTASSTLAQALSKLRDSVLEPDKMEISSIGDLLLALRRSAIDREKLTAVKKFIDQSGEELYYLGERMDEVMAAFMFQSSRRQLLDDLISRHIQAHESQKTLTKHQHEEDAMKQQEHDRAMRRTEYLLSAVHAADKQVKKLEYWSDIKDMSDATAVAEKAEESHDQPSFQNKQDPSEAANNAGRSVMFEKEKGNDTAYGTASEASRKRVGQWRDLGTRSSKGKGKAREDENELERFVTASEDAIEAREQSSHSGKANARSVDGVTDDDEKK